MATVKSLFVDCGTISGVNPTAIHDRMSAAAGERTFRHLGELTRTNSETVRRYMSGQAPSAEYLASFCEALGINADWLLTGRGPMKRVDVKSHALRQADPAELLSAMAQTLERLIDRVERIEVFVQTLETRVRGRAMPLPARPVAVGNPGAGGTGAIPSSSVGGTSSPSPMHEKTHDAGSTHGASVGRGGSAGTAPSNPDRTARIKLPEPQRPRPDDR